jgi:anti-anti-sigma factor
VDDGLDPVEAGSVEILTRAEQDAVVLAVRGEVDSQTIPALSAAVTDAISRTGVRCVILDLDQVAFFGSAGIAFLTQTNAEARGHQVELRLVAGEATRVYRVLEMMGLTRLLAIFPTIAGALRGR